jgi:toxin ParE1/3/4
MSFEIIVTPSADAEITEAYQWYEEQRQGLGEEFLNELERSQSIIKQDPFLFQIRHNQKRVAPLHRFPYLLIYEIEEVSFILYAVFHTSREPKNW